MDSEPINQCRDYAIPFYDKRSSNDLAKGLNKVKTVEAKSEGSTGERWKWVKLAGPPRSWYPEGERKVRH